MLASSGEPGPSARLRERECLVNAERLRRSAHRPALRAARGERPALGFGCGNGSFAAGK
jgi:hypothetical protein